MTKQTIATAVLALLITSIGLAQGDDWHTLPQNWKDGDKVEVTTTSGSQMFMGDSLFMSSKSAVSYQLHVKTDYKGYVVTYGGQKTQMFDMNMDNMMMSKMGMQEFMNQLIQDMTGVMEAATNFDLEVRVDKESGLATGIENEEEYVDFFYGMMDTLIPVLKNSLKSGMETFSAAHGDSVDVESMMAMFPDAALKQMLVEKKDEMLATAVNNVNLFLQRYSMPYSPDGEISYEVETYEADQLSPEFADTTYMTYTTVNTTRLAGNKLRIVTVGKPDSEAIYGIFQVRAPEKLRMVESADDMSFDQKDTMVFDMNTSWPVSIASSYEVVMGVVRVSITEDTSVRKVK